MHDNHLFLEFSIPVYIGPCNGWSNTSSLFVLSGEWKHWDSLRCGNSVACDNMYREAYDINTSKP